MVDRQASVSIWVPVKRNPALRDGIQAACEFTQRLLVVLAPQ